jgi:hypothetical protein
MFCSWHTRAVGCCIAAVVAAAGLAACSTHPLPQDVAGIPTVGIVKSIRCEVRAGIERAVLGLKDDEVAKIVPIVKASVIGYDFNFNMHEENSAGNIDAGTPLLRFIQPGGRFTGRVNGTATLDRRNIRTFTIIEPLVELMKPEIVEACKDGGRGPNLAYPVAGTIGLDEVVRTYLKLELLTDLHDVKKGPGKARFSDSHVVFSDQLNFTTEFDAGATGTLVFDAVVGRVRLTNVSVGASASRTDTHSVIVALSRDPRGGTQTTRTSSSGGAGGKGGGKADNGSKGGQATKGDKGSKGGQAAKGDKGGKEGQAAKGDKGGKETDVAKEDEMAECAARPKETPAEERDRLICNGSVRDPRAQARLFQMNASAQDSVAVELQQRRARKDEDDDAARALGQRFLDLLKVP